MEHPKTSRLAKAANKIILARLSKRLEQAKGLWPDELYTVLWPYTLQPAHQLRKHYTDWCTEHMHNPHRIVGTMFEDSNHERGI